MGKSVLQTVLPLAAAVAAPYAIGAMGAGGALGAGAGAAGAGAGTAAGGAGALGGAFGSADMLAAASPGLLNAGAAAAVPGSIESAGLLDMGAGNMVNPEYFVGEGMGTPLYSGSPDLPFSQKAGNILDSFSDKMGGNPMKMMNIGQPQQTQQVSRPPAIQRPQSQPSTTAQLPYNQGIQLSPEQREMLRQRMMMGGLLNGTA